MIEPIFTPEEIAKWNAIKDDDLESVEGIRAEQYESRRKLFYPGRKIEGTLLTVLGTRGSVRGPEVLCQCACNKTIAIRYRTLYNGGVYSCGCTIRPGTERVDRRPSRDYSGQTFGRLVVLNYTDLGWECLCQDCQELEMISPIPGQSYLALLNRAGKKPCKITEAIEAKKPLWFASVTWKVGTNDCTTVDSTESARGANEAEARERILTKMRKDEIARHHKIVRIKRADQS
jgi:hypothetical protein